MIDNICRREYFETLTIKISLVQIAFPLDKYFMKLLLNNRFNIFPLVQVYLLLSN